MADTRKMKILEQIQLLASKVPSSSSTESANLAREILLAARRLSASTQSEEVVSVGDPTVEEIELITEVVRTRPLERP